LLLGLRWLRFAWWRRAHGLPLQGISWWRLARTSALLRRSGARSLSFAPGAGSVGASWAWRTCAGISGTFDGSTCPPS